ncbi:Tex family protein [Piscirickettsia litoralis]|uniref:RNA-binding transcriptional accessory protein n=1 Tax=Piscirickettsia litoralis TaxID=1891921 RepID=A0ABX3A175_9GAMM|nr:Tex family protein [Piscirickettsia litoralis]ODN42617.1 RNA-binding transcriptional accessory protein [Piscirickettsia litoralis]
MNINLKIAEELKVKEWQVTAAINLLDEGATVPFIARYRKEVTGTLDDSELRTLEERLRYLRELEERRETILKSISEQEKLTPELKAKILEAETKHQLEDLYLPFKPKRRTKGQIAIEAGLEPLADALFNDPSLPPEVEAEKYINKDQSITDIKKALEGARYILMERFAEDATLIEKVRQLLQNSAEIQSTVINGQEEAGAKFKDYFEFSEKITKIPSHRALALFRGRSEGVLNLQLLPEPAPTETGSAQSEILIADHLNFKHQSRPADSWLQETIRWTWRIKLLTRLESEFFTLIRERAEEEAIKVFATNLKDLLLAAPAGARPTLGLDPGLRTGVKVVAVDAIGKLVEYTTIFPHAPKKQWDQSIHIIAELIKKHSIELVSIGNGTASRETDQLVLAVKKQFPELKFTQIMVSEAGASVYSASELAAQEFPELDVSFRGAVSIARRLQDPLAELVKIEPKAIGVGQYQHDVNQVQLARSLDGVVEDCVNSIGVDVNMASAPLLTRIAGLNNTIAQNIVNYRNEQGPFKNRTALKKVPRLGAKTFEQAAGFLRINHGDNPLDASAVHPETYAVVKDIAAKNDQNIAGLIGNHNFLSQLKAHDYINDQFGEPTIKDIINELDKPGRDPRPEFKTATFKENVHEIKDLTENMILEGVVTNVTNFGAFVDIGVHQDGLVHISVLADRFVSDPREIVKAGDIVKVKVVDIDIPRRRIGLSMRLNDSATQSSTSSNKGQKSTESKAKTGPYHKPVKQQPAQGESAMAAAFAKLNLKNR